MTNLRVEALTCESFAPFGEVIEASEAVRHFPINGGNTERYHDLARLDAGPDGQLIVSIFRGQPRALPFTIRMMERHPLGSQAFMPLSGQPYLVVVAPPGAAPGAQDLRCFLAGPQQGVNYAPGTWHHPLLALDTVSDFLVLDRSGSTPNCDETLLEPVAIIPAETLPR
ncbi:ureidoglycolate lyase [Uliginosibacterium sp. 31-16]|uniref:ureidoglycolate lyase n=1 Tax=Uliginosibacterium sp. 31-16 TaxID=3068315 RepID=UPI00273F901D|nr:ureidoglycolate lyase [Uliginosibacterium sp. 31-16]MDP5238312.1 ureidoglycolate lyase [Uliginosibacterium sp. 31-16]